MRDYKTIPIPDSVWQKPSHFIAFGLGSGVMPFAPGTFGTLMAIPFYIMMQSFSNTLYFFVVLLITLASMWLTDKVSKEINVHDHPGMCIDEFVGFFVTMFAAPKGFLWIALGFGLFRFFDIVKPWPINYVDTHVKGGVGVILDDVIAGVFSCIVLHIIHWLFF